MKRAINLQLLDGKYAISRLRADAPLPPWADGPGFVSISRTDEELSIVCEESRVPTDVETDREWVCMKFVGPFSLYETGIVLSVVQPLSEGGIGVFVVSTYNGDHLLMKNDDLLHAQMLLQNAGHALG